MHKTTRLKLNDLNPHLVCVLCGGYFIEATAIIECLHSFCRSCITKYLEGSKCCPICDVQVHKTRPLLNLRPDKTLQNLVYKLVPGLYKQEMQRRREFYKVHPDSAPSTTSPNACEERGEVDSERYSQQEEPEKISVVMQHCDRLPLPSNGIHRKTGREGKNIKTGSDKRFLLCPAGVTVEHLKKFLRCKFDIKEDYQVELFYHDDETLPEDYTLADVAYVYGWTRAEPLRIFYVVLDTREVCLRLPTPATSAPIILNKKTSPEHLSKHSDETGFESQQPLESDHRSEEHPTLPCSVEDEDEDDCDPEIAYPTTPSPVPLKEDYPSPSSEERSEVVTEPHEKEHSRKHSHKKKKKKKKHKRSKSKEDKEVTEEMRSVIKVRIPKDKICQSVFTDSLGLDTPEESYDEDGVCSPVVPFQGSSFEKFFSGKYSDVDQDISLRESDKDDKFCSFGESSSDGLSKDIKTREFPSGGSVSDSVFGLHDCDKDSSNINSINSSVCSSPQHDALGSRITDNLLDKTSPDSPFVANDNYSEEISFFTDSEQDSSFESSQTSRKEYTCEISRDGKVLLHSAKSGNGSKKVLPSMNIVIEETPPQIIVVDKDVEMPKDTLSSDGSSEFQRLDEDQPTKISKELSNVCSKKLADPSGDGIVVDGAVETEPSVLVEVDESGAIMDTKLTEKVSDAVKPGSSSPSDGTCTPDEPMSSARTDAHAFHKTKEVQTVCSNIPLNVHSSLSPPDVKNSLKRTKTTESGTSYKQAKLSTKNNGYVKHDTECTHTSGVLAGPSFVQPNVVPGPNVDKTGIITKPKANFGVHSSLSPPSTSTGKMRVDKRPSGVEAHGHLDFKGKLPYTNTNSIASTSAHAYHQSIQMMARVERELSSRKSNKRGPLKERPVTLPVSHTAPVKPCSPAPKPAAYGQVPNYPLFQPHIHPSLSAISAIAAQVHGQPHIPAPMKQLRLMCGEMGMQTPLLTPQSLPQGYAMPAPGYLASSRHFLSPIFSPPVPARSMPSPLSPTRASPLSPNHFGPLSPAHFGPMSPPRHSPPGIPPMVGTHPKVPGYDSPLELTTRKAQDRHREGAQGRSGVSATSTSAKP